MEHLNLEDGVDAASDFRPVGRTLRGARHDSQLTIGLAANLYHSDRDALSCSMLKPLLVSPAHFQTALVTPSPSTEAMTLGTLVHLLVLEPHQASSELAVFPGMADKRSREYREFAELHKQRLVVDEPAFAEALRLAERVLSTRYKGRPLRAFINESIPEATMYFTEPTTGLRLRTRLDAYHPDVTFDLKTTRFACAAAFSRDAVDKHYDLQAYMYTCARCAYEGRDEAPPFVFITAESSEPHSVSTLQAGSSFMTNGAKKFQACVAAFAACSRLEIWPDLGTDGEIELEPWQQFNLAQGWRSALANEVDRA